MLYATIKHDTLVPGQAWTCVSECVADRVVIVAVDKYPEGVAVNVVIEVATDSGAPQKLLAPIAWSNLKPDLKESIESDIDTSEHQTDYAEWKRVANEGQAGVWTCSIGKIVQSVTSPAVDT